MKTTFKTTLFATLIILVASCTKEIQNHEESGLVGITLKAGVEGIQDVSKVYFNDWSNYELYWANGDEISVFSNTVNSKFTNSKVDGKSAEFSGTVTPAGTYQALYPYDASASISGNVISTTFPADQVAGLNGTDKHALMAVSVSDGDILNFKNIYGLLKFNLVDENVTSVTLEGNNNEVIAGNIDITLGDEPSYTVTGNASTTITLTPGAGEAFAAGDYAFALLPVEFTKGFKLIFTKAETAKAAIKSTKGSISQNVGRSSGLNAKDFTFDEKDYCYYYIRTKADLDAWNADVNKWGGVDRVYLANDIDYQGGSWTCASGHDFVGLFDGRGHSITNINITGTDPGLIKRVVGQVRNLTIGSATDNSTVVCTDVSSDKAVGSVANLIVNGKIENVTNYAKISAGTNGTYCGGIAGRIQKGSVKGCINYGTVSSSAAHAKSFVMGGIAGYCETDSTYVIECTNYAALTNSHNGSNAFIGGIVGRVNVKSLVKNCTNEGTVTTSGTMSGSVYLGGIMGSNTGGAATIENCTNAATADITNSCSAAQIFLGGILGNASVASVLNICTNSGDILDEGLCSDAYAENTTAGYARTGGILGSSAAASKLTDCTNNGRVEVNSQSVYMNIGGIMGLNNAAAAVMTRCVNTGYVGSTPVNNNGNQLIRIAGIVGFSAIAGTVIEACENYGDLKLDNNYTIFRNWIGGAIGYCKTSKINNGKYNAVLSRVGSVTNGAVGGINGQNDTQGGELGYNGLAGTVLSTVITKDNFNNYLQGNSKGYDTGKKVGNYFLETSAVTSATGASEQLSSDLTNVNLN